MQMFILRTALYNSVDDNFYYPINNYVIHEFISCKYNLFDSLYYFYIHFYNNSY